MTMKPTMSCFVILLFLELLAMATISRGFRNVSSYVGCIEREREALLRFKKDLIDHSDRLASWTADGDCCTWVGVICDNFTGHVLELRLRNPSAYTIGGRNVESFFINDAYKSSVLAGKINPSLLDLENLIHLDLSSNNFEGNQIPTFLGSMRNLNYLNLSDTGLIGMIPHQLGNLSNLQYLDLGTKGYTFDGGILYVDNFQWLSDLHLLKHLDLGRVNLSKTFDQWLSVTNALPSLEVLKLSGCQLHHLPPLLIANFSSLTSLDLSSNPFDNTLIPSWVFSLNHLVFLDLGYNNFQGPIPDGIQNLTSLQYLDLSGNLFNFSTPHWLYRLGHLEHLILGDNELQGNISDVLGNLTSIMELDFSDNRLEGKFPRSLERLCNLKFFVFSNNRLNQDISEVLDILSRCVINQLEYLALSDNHLFGHLTNRLGQFKNIKVIDISSNFISGPIPPCMGELSSLRYLMLSTNKLNGSLHEIHFKNLSNLLLFSGSKNSLTLEVGRDWTPPFHQIVALDLGSCSLGPQFPSWFLSLKSLLYLDISNSGIVDIIPIKFWKFLPQSFFFNFSHNQIHGQIPNLPKTGRLETLDLSSNNLTGPLPFLSSDVYAIDFSYNSLSGSISRFLCYRMHESKRMQILNLRKNLLYGEIPDCFMNWKAIEVLYLSDNDFIGKLPISIGSLSSLQSLHLRGNRLSGTIPLSLQNCTELIALDLSDNAFDGNVPNWIGKSLSKLKILNILANNFHGLLPVELCSLTHMRILDLAYNNLFGSIPRCVGNLTAMATMDYSVANHIRCYSNSNISSAVVVEDALLVMKGTAVEYNTILNLVKLIDLSKNNFSGEIPGEITNLGALMSLNLSHNSFTGRIPKSIGVMRRLENFDLSNNQLSGEIPQSISDLTFLNRLNISNNKLFGKIPSSTQLQSLEASSFVGNELCGSPLPKNCTESSLSVLDHGSGESDNGNENEVDWFYVSMALGFVVGLWSVIGPLIVNRRWRYMYSDFLDRLGDKCGSTVVSKRR